MKNLLIKDHIEQRCKEQRTRISPITQQKSLCSFNPLIKTKTIVYLVGIVFFAIGCSSKKSNEELIQTVKVDTAHVYGEKQQATFPGKIKAASDVNLAFRISGPILKLYVEAGDYVKKDQVLAEIDSRDYAIQLAATEAEYKQVKAEAGRIISLHEKGSATPNDYDKAVYGLNQITAKYDAHKNALADTKLRAPFDGYVQQCLFDKDETVGAGTPVIALINAGIPEVEINIPASDFIRRDHFESYVCAVDLFPDRLFPLELVGIAQKANLNQLYTMRLRIKDNTPPLPSPGMAAMVSIRFKSEKSALTSIPLTALFDQKGISSVWIYNPIDQTISSRQVKLHEIRTDGTIVVSEGVQDGEIVVSAGVHSLKQGEKVRLLTPVSGSNIGGLL